jgi:hypothetical protein
MIHNSIAQIVVWDSRVYIPRTARYKNGIFVNIEPVVVVRPNIDEIVSVLETNMRQELPLLKDPSPEEVKARSDLLPKMTGAKSWKKLCLKGVNYIIGYSDSEISLGMSRLDSKGRWEFDPDKQKRYHLGTSISIIVQDILNDMASRKY